MPQEVPGAKVQKTGRIEFIVLQWTNGLCLLVTPVRWAVRAVEKMARVPAGEVRVRGAEGDFVAC